ncbi:MAG TPA: hypothetical protein VIF62_14510 [Labilithrix sp.]|jgi:hypothetical protein
MRRVLATVVAACIGTAACANSNDTEVGQPVVLGMLDTVPPVYDDGEVQMYQVEKQVPLPIRPPKDGERPSGDVDPYPDHPYYLASDTRITVRFTLSSLEDKPVNVWLLLDGWNEFVAYVPGLVVGDEETIPNRSGRELAFVLQPRQRVEGIITPDDMVELATDLATGMKIKESPPAGDSQFGGPVLYNRANDPQNRSNQPDIVLGPYIPQVIAGITGFDLGIRTYDHAKVAVEIVADVEDLKGDLVIPSDEKKDPIGRPGEELAPPAGGPMAN